jgi:hypothetical protein
VFHYEHKSFILKVAVCPEDQEIISGAQDNTIIFLVKLN